MKKKFIISFILILIAIVSIKHNHKIKTYFVEEKYYKVLAQLNLIKRCFQPMQNFQDVFIQEGIEYNKANEAVVLDGLNKLKSNLQEGSDLKIPAITHHIYFSSNIKKLNDFYIAKMTANFEKLNALESRWKHYIWTNNPEIFPQEIIHFKGVEIKDINELNGHILYQNLIYVLNKGVNSRAYFAEGSDILRFMVVNQFGGIYQDMDYEIYNAKALESLMKKFDFIGGRENNNSESYYGSAFFAAKANHPILNNAIEMKYRNLDDKKMPEYIKYPCYSNDLIYFNSPPLLTVAYFNRNNIDGNSDIILPSWMIFNNIFARFKNKTCAYNDIKKEEFEYNNQNLKKLMIEFKSLNKEDSKFDIIGADMFCGNWYDDQHNSKTQYRWNWFWDK